ncbi:helix-turn-helix domain-containing protein [Pedobacter alpinus]|uniref:Helix-turn-helix domain-containing protein n=1 Tax=Pedobacter alpinus TaxID=1590643 RepID=A0ABW5TUZ8_9SPHI
MTGEKIRIQRVIKGYSQEYMAFMLSISQSTYSKMESEQVEITVQRLFEVAEILKVEITALLPESKQGNIVNLNILAKLFSLVKIKFRKYMAKSKFSNAA